jgi:hypothetical protein
MSASVVFGYGLERLTAVSPRQDLVDLAVRMAIDDPDQGVGEIGERNACRQVAVISAVSSSLPLRIQENAISCRLNRYYGLPAAWLIQDQRSLQA